MVDKHGVRIGTLFGSALALVMACSSRTVDLNKGSGHQKSDAAVDNGGSGDTDGGNIGAGGAGASGTDGGSFGGGSVSDGGANVGGSGNGSGGGTNAPNKPSTVKKSNKLDLLLMVDNSISMADKQTVLSKSIPDLIQRVADPASGFTDLHVGVITSSIGGHGATLCKGNDMSGNIEDQEQNDHGYLIGMRPRFSDALAAYPDALAPTPQGFIEWTPDKGSSGLVSGISAMIQAAGEFGCGLESQLEAVQRFLVDPNPYQQIVTQNCPNTTEQCAVPTGRDMNLLAQRAAFLRPDSVVAIVELTDENDCSIQETGQYFYAARNDIVLPHGSAQCAQNPNDPCCYFCNASPPSGCAPDPMCPTATPPSQDQPNLRCFHEKQRFGFDFLYPVQRYVNALTRTQVCTSRADLASDPSYCRDLDGDKKPDVFDNPLFVGKDGTVRDPSMVYFLGIVGVPYQDLAASSSGTLAYQTPAQLTAHGVWDKVIGNENPGNFAPPVTPTDGLMIESKDPRGGSDGETPPVALAPTSAGPAANPVNGHEWSNPGQDDLQYACIFPLPEPRDCAKAEQENPQPGCDCKPADLMGADNPLCQDAQGNYSTTQLRAKAYPGIRELQLIQALGSTGLASSICAKNLTDDTKADFGYRPAIDLMLNQIKQSAK